ncbi:MAG TPA: RNA polymerase factor sigma-54 [Thermohalobaculum sp.]|nr:RNA polymerase factor sigma-54 [Thermohalobaculum sp.]
MSGRAGLGLELRQTQQLVMTPQLQQAIRLLELPNLELGAHVAEICERNPLVTLEHAPGVEREGAPAEAEASPATARENLHDTRPGDGPGAMPRHPGQGTGAGRREGPDRPLEDRAVELPTLAVHLHAQIGQMRAERQLVLLARALVEMLDEHGFLRADLDRLAERLGVPPERLGAALRLVQACSPTGVGARSLGECLGLQLAERGRLDPAMQTLLDNLDLLARGEARRLRRLTGVDEQDFAEMLAEIRALDPRPCAGFGAEEPATMVPDVFVRRSGDGDWQVELNTETLPRVLIDRTYAASLRRDGSERALELRRFLAESRAEASWLVKSLEQRARTMLTVAAELVRHQERFLEEGETALRPLTLRAVAEATGLHESTVSRVTANKYVATPRGTHPMRTFFTNAVGGDDGPAASSIRHRIRTLVAAEAGDAVLSDDGIVEALAREGIKVARRTVAKYRKTLSIPSSVDRRRRKAIAAQ